MKKFDLEKALSGEKVVTSDGNKVSEIYLFKTSTSNQPLLACIIREDEKFNDIQRFNIDGTWNHNSTPHPLDLFMAPNKKTGWINIYKDEFNEICGQIIFPTEQLAEREIVNCANAVDCIQIEWEE